MTRFELIQRVIVNQSHLPATEVESAVKHILTTIRQDIAAGNRIEIRGFGSFSLKFRKAHIARNPKTGEQVMAKNKYKAYFRPAKEMRERVNNNS